MDSVAPSGTEFENVAQTYYVLTKRGGGSSHSISRVTIEGITTNETFALEWRMRTALDRGDWTYDSVDLKLAGSFEELERLQHEKELRERAQMALTYLKGLTPEVRDALAELGYGFNTKSEAVAQ